MRCAERSKMGVKRRRGSVNGAKLKKHKGFIDWNRGQNLPPCTGRSYAFRAGCSTAIRK